MLNLPQNFKNDIQGKDTALFPIVVINNIDEDFRLFLSTNQYSWNKHDNSEVFTTIPILLNIPSLKESIDIEKRNYKISSINIDISNFPYNGERFSDLIGDNSLINTEVRIFWVSPSTDTLIYVDKDGNEYSDMEDEGKAPHFEAYFGTIRRYTHDGEKVRLVVEDRSQATLHKDLPLPENYLTGAEVPDKYKNKPIPMVYGHVDRSPGVISTDTIENVADEGADISSGTFKVIFDKLGAGISFLSGLDSHHRLRHSPLFVYLGEVYLPIAWFKDNAKNFMPGANDYVGNYENSNLIVNSSDSTITFDTGNAYSDSRFNNIRVNYPRPLGNTSFVIFSLLYFNNYNHINYDWNEKPYIHPDFPIDNIKIYGSPSTKIDGEVLAHHGYLELGSFNYVSLYSSPPIYIKIILDPVSEISDIVESKGYAFISASTSSTQDDRVMSAIWTKEVLNPDDTGNTAGYFYRNIETGQTKILENYPGSVVFFDGDFDNSGTSTEPYNSILLQNFDTNDNMINIGIPPHSLDDEGGGLPPQVLELGQYFKDLNLVNSIVIEGISNKTYYANIFGRAMDGTNSPTAPSAIKDILVSELGQLATDIDTFPTDYSTWKYAFTIDKKINSKKLIEGIASASPYIPRFDNMGNFRFDVIKLTYNPTDIESDNHTIKEADCIDFSFKRTPIEDVVTKIEFKYKWDYARGEFSKRRVLDIQYFACADWDGNFESFSYYGLPDPTPNNDTYNTWTHLESTLVIDDDRGKYIRDNDTAEKFVCWMMSWYCNQHLIMKVKLPLKYMNLEIGDIIDFDYLLGDISPYGIDYTSQSNGVPTFQAFFPFFMVTETNKRLDYVEISCIQMHQLWAEGADSTDEDGNMSYV